ncbi:MULTISPECIES: Nif3-like dinuclear metal center hexameric protein [Saccharibacillus]|uniref:Nif3-like dinuclear metal center hexameric protein n=1 Tax=Saccharibacillus TaxID=456492 RepID=UPI00123C1FD8|nr:Nif3-like dinuclear metal center hexameric protein [Saccharibacillus sp. WB 17]MWJ30637.1 transcriptional regulator [Saccharibacillus sp. WB 17]
MPITPIIPTVPTVRTVIDALLAPAASMPEPTVDRLLHGRPDLPVTGIVTAFMPTLRVIGQAREAGANLVIAHEGLFFSHLERGAEAAENEVARAKRQAVERSGIAVYRCHDALHRYVPDGVTAALAEALGWAPYVREHRPEAALADLPPAALGEIAAGIKRRLGLPALRLAGDPAAICSRAVLLAGYRGGGALAIPLLEAERADLVVYGEGPEWETPEYVREANRLGRPCGLIALGHAESEEPGMAALAVRLAGLFPHIPVRHIREEPVFRSV